MSFISLEVAADSLPPLTTPLRVPTFKIGNKTAHEKYSELHTRFCNVEIRVKKSCFV